MMILRRRSTADALRSFLNQDDPVAPQLRPLWHAHGRFPTRCTWARRLAVLTPHVPGLLGGFGRHLVAVRTPWASHGRAAAVDSPP